MTTRIGSAAGASAIGARLSAVLAATTYARTRAYARPRGRRLCREEGPARARVSPARSRATGDDRTRCAPSRADLLRRRSYDPLLPGRGRLPVGRDLREPRLPGLDAFLLRHRQREHARVLRLSRSRPRAGRRDP